jgi:ABC-type amino acid transport system permease subunit
MLNLNLNRLFYIHREAAIAVITGLLFLAHTLAYLAADDAFVQAVMTFGAVVYLFITSCLVYGIYRFEKKWGGA